jgi:defect-in-organelle-trafficking protein DotC
MPLFPAANKKRLLRASAAVFGAAAVCFFAAPVAAQQQQNPPSLESIAQAITALQGATQGGTMPFGNPGTYDAEAGPGQQNPLSFPLGQRQEERPRMSEKDMDEALKDPDSPQYKADRLAKRAKKDIDFFGRTAQKEEETENILDMMPSPPEMAKLQNVHQTHGSSYDVSDDLISKEMALDMRKDAQREAALSYGARGGLAKRSYEIAEKLHGFSPIFDKVFAFRQLLIQAPSGLLIEPPIVSETLDALVITEGGDEAAVTDQLLKINRQAKIVTAPREWRQYIVSVYGTDIAPPPRVLWPKDLIEQGQWNEWVLQGWQQGYLQGDEIFERNLNQLVADYSGMVRYRMLLAQGKISHPYAMQEDRGVTSAKNRSEMRVGDRALRITGPAQFLTGAEEWKPADR